MTKKYPQEFKDVLLTLTKNLMGLLDLFECQYVACGGTLLGCVREQGFIEHDYDVDFELLPSSENRARFFTMTRYIERSPEKFLMRVQHQLPHITKFCPVTTYGFYKAAMFDRDDVPNPTVDMFYMQGSDAKGFSLVDKKWPKWTYLTGEMFPITKRPFAGMSVNTACRPHGVLERYYGDYMTPTFQEWPDTSKNKKSREANQKRFKSSLSK